MYLIGALAACGDQFAWHVQRVRAFCCACILSSSIPESLGVRRYGDVSPHPQLYRKAIEMQWWNCSCCGATWGSATMT